LTSSNTASLAITSSIIALGAASTARDGFHW